MVGDLLQPLSSARRQWLSETGLAVRTGLLRVSDARGGSFRQNRSTTTPSLFQRRLLSWPGPRQCRRAPGSPPAYMQFCQDHARWLEDYALFRALKSRHGGAHYLDWPVELTRRAPGALTQARRELAREIDQVRLAQFLLFRQAARLKQHAQARGVRLIGDLPFFVSPDSSDVWANPELFLLHEHGRPRVVAGVPPDYFSAQGQLWGNPVYDWDALRRTGYRWWVDRLRALLAHVDIIRLDHFRAFAAAWHVPAGAPTAQTGSWVPGPGAKFFSTVQKELRGLPFIAEDLGLITPDVYVLRDRFSVPGTRVLQFAFDGHADNPYCAKQLCREHRGISAPMKTPQTREWYRISGRPAAKTSGFSEAFRGLTAARRRPR